MDACAVAVPSKLAPGGSRERNAESAAPDVLDVPAELDMLEELLKFESG